MLVRPWGFFRTPLLRAVAKAYATVRSTINALLGLLMTF